MSFPVTSSKKKDLRASPLWGLFASLLQAGLVANIGNNSEASLQIELGQHGRVQQGVTKFELGQQPKLVNQTNIQIKT